MRITSIGAVHHSSDGVLLLDVSLDSAGVPDGVDLAWQSKHFLGMPVPGVTTATVNLAHVVAAVEFLASLTIDPPNDGDAPTSAEVLIEMSRMADEASHAKPASSAAPLSSHVGGSMAQLGEPPPRSRWAIGHQLAAGDESEKGEKAEGVTKPSWLTSGSS
jgi:hypothetical protein